MSRKEYVICDHCGKQEEEPVGGWIETRLYGFDIRCWPDDEPMERLFCSWACVRDHATKRVPSVESGEKRFFTDEEILKEFKVPPEKWDEVRALSIPESDLTGNFIDEYCPKCGARLLGNKQGDKWCSFISCYYGLGG